jgi:hypothetical protein
MYYSSIASNGAVDNQHQRSGRSSAPKNVVACIPNFNFNSCKSRIGIDLLLSTRGTAKQIRRRDATVVLMHPVTENLDTKGLLAIKD